MYMSQGDNDNSGSSWVYISWYTGTEKLTWALTSAWSWNIIHLCWKKKTTMNLILNMTLGTYLEMSLRNVWHFIFSQQDLFQKCYFFLHQMLSHSFPHTTISDNELAMNQSWDCFIFLMGLPILIRDNLYIESPRVSQTYSVELICFMHRNLK